MPKPAIIQAMKQGFPETARTHHGGQIAIGRGDHPYIRLERVACLDSLVAKRACGEERIEHGKSLLVRVVSMRSKRVDRFSPATQRREDHVR